MANPVLSHYQHSIHNEPNIKVIKYLFILNIV